MVAETKARRRPEASEGERSGGGQERWDYEWEGRVWAGKRFCKAYSLSLPSPSSVQQHPIIHPIFDLARSSQRLGEQVSEEVVVGRFGETELSDVVEVDGEFLCESASSRQPLLKFLHNSYLAYEGNSPPTPESA